MSVNAREPSCSAQWEAISSVELSASAGSGKTYRLTQILHEKLSSGQARPAGVIE